MVATLQYLYPAQRKEVKAAVENGGPTGGLGPFAVWAVAVYRQYDKEAKEGGQVAAVARFRQVLRRAVATQYNTDVFNRVSRTYTERGRTKTLGAPPAFPLLPLMTSAKQFVPISNYSANAIIHVLGLRVLRDTKGLQCLFNCDDPAFQRLQ